MNRIRELRKGCRMSQSDLCKHLGVTQGTLSGWETGRYQPDIGTLTSIAALFDVSVDHLLGLDARAKSHLRIPVYNKIPSGTPIDALKAQDGYETLGTERLDATGSYFGFRVTDNSMRPAYAENDTLIIRIQPTAETGDDAVVHIGGHNAILRRITHTPRGLTLRPLNLDHEPLFFLHEEVTALPIRILGTAIEVRRRIRG